jgi:hypothetical protein
MEFVADVTKDADDKWVAEVYNIHLTSVPSVLKSEDEDSLRDKIELRVLNEAAADSLSSSSNHDDFDVKFRVRTLHIKVVPKKRDGDDTAVCAGRRHIQLHLTLVFCPSPKYFLIKTFSDSLVKDVLDKALCLVYHSHTYVIDYFQLSIPDPDGGTILNPNKQLDRQGVHDDMELNVEAKLKSRARDIYEIGGMLPMFTN